MFLNAYTKCCIDKENIRFWKVHTVLWFLFWFVVNCFFFWQMVGILLGVKGQYIWIYKLDWIVKWYIKLESLISVFFLIYRLWRSNIKNVFYFFSMDTVKGNFCYMCFGRKVVYGRVVCMCRGLTIVLYSALSVFVLCWIWKV